MQRNNKICILQPEWSISGNTLLERPLLPIFAISTNSCCQLEVFAATPQVHDHMHHQVAVAASWSCHHHVHHQVYHQPGPGAVSFCCRLTSAQEVDEIRFPFRLDLRFCWDFLVSIMALTRERGNALNTKGGFWQFEIRDKFQGRLPGPNRSLWPLPEICKWSLGLDWKLLDSLTILYNSHCPFYNWLKGTFTSECELIYQMWSLSNRQLVHLSICLDALFDVFNLSKCFHSSLSTQEVSLSVWWSTDTVSLGRDFKVCSKGNSSFPCLVSHGTAMLWLHHLT